MIATLPRIRALLCVLAFCCPATAQPDPPALTHLHAGEAFIARRDFLSAALQFNAALKADADPSWTLVWAHIDLGRLLDVTGQRARAILQYQLALETKDDTFNALSVAARYLTQPATLDEIAPLALPTPPASGGTVLTRTEPEYTPEARLARLEGTVKIAVSLDRTGNITDLHLLDSLGLGLDDAAVNAVRRWTFTPYIAGGQPTPVTTNVDVIFKLPGKNPGWHIKKISFAKPDAAGRPVFLRIADFAPSKMTPELEDEAAIDVAIRRNPTATASFEVDTLGHPTKLQLNSASLPIWGADALRAIAEWQFRPATQGDTRIAVPCAVELAWFGGS